VRDVEPNLSRAILSDNCERDQDTDTLIGADMKPTRRVWRLAALFVVCLLSQAQAKPAGDVIVMTSGTFTAAHLELVPDFERTTRVKVTTAATSQGVGADSIPSRVRRGEPVDVVIMAADAVDALIKEGLVSGGRVDLARSAIGMAVRAGARKPDISSVAALTRTLLDARSVAVSSSVSGNYFTNELFPRLGIAEPLKGKVQRIEGERVGDVVARGDAEIGFQQISELLPIVGIDLVGPLPLEVQRVTVFAAGLVANTKHPDAARAFIRFVSSRAAAAVVVKTGLEPLIGP
jgi:molybdate transport system substrate-binding protein